MTAEVSISLDASEFVAFCDEVVEIAERRGHLPAFRKVLSKLRKAVRDPFDSVASDFDAGSARAGQFVYVLKVSEPLLELLAALRTLDRNLDSVGTVHGNPS